MKTLFMAMMAIVAVITAGCGTNGSSQSRSENARGESLIDQKDYNQAIFTLMTRVQQNPQDHRAHVLLASALAARHGIVMTKFSGFARVLIDWKNQPNPDAGAPGSFAAMKQLAWQAELIVKALSALPAISNQQELNDLGFAIYTLEGLTLTSGEYYYRALLKLVMFKYNLDHGFALETTDACDVEPQKLGQWLQNVDASLGDIINDISLGVKIPAERLRLQQLQKQISSIAKGMEESLASEEAPEGVVKVPKMLQKLYPKCG